jgi:hypothetical protein
MEVITLFDRIKVKDSEEYLEDSREIWRIQGEEFV